MRRIGLGAGGAVENSFQNAPLGLANPIFNVGMGISPVLVGFAMAFPRIWEIFLDPWIGTVSGTVTVASGASLGGSGFISGATTLQSGSLLRPGNSPGILTFNSNLTLENGANMVWELWANTVSNSPLAYDQVMVGGNLTFGGSNGITLDFGTSAGGSSVNWTDTFWHSQQSWIVYDVTGTTTGNLSLLNSVYNDATGASLADARAGASFNLSLNGNDVMLNYVPEPSSSSLLLLSLAGLAALRKFRGKA